MKILFVTAKKDAPSTRWRIAQFIPHFEKKGHVCALEEVPSGMIAKLGLAKRAMQFDLVVLQKKLVPKLVFNRLRKFARKLIYEFDDNVTLKRAEDGSIRSSSTRERRFRRAVRGADAVTTTNEVLAELARRALDDPSRVHIFPSVVDLSKYAPRTKRGEGPPTIGWMGSESNLDYLEVVRQPLARLCRRYEGLTVKIVCEKAIALEGVRLEHKLFTPGDELADLHSFDVAIAPLVEDPWTRGKISTKVLSYFGAGLPVVASNVGSNRIYVRDGQNGYLAGTLTEWEDRLTTLLQDVDHREKMGAAARESVERDFSIEAMVPRYLMLFENLFATPGEAVG